MAKYKTGGAAAALGLLSCTALVHAADLPPRVAPPVFTAPVLINNWDGFYAGTTYGIGFTDFKSKQVGGTSRSTSTSGSVGGALVGYNFQYGHFVFGPEGSIDINDVRTESRSRPGYNGAAYDDLYDIRLRGRLGYEFGWFMPFVAGGADINETNQSANVPFNSRGQNHQTVGYTVGAGIDVKVNPARLLPFNSGFLNTFLGPLILRVEYLHDELPDSTYAYAGQRYRTHPESDTVRAALISRFGDNPPRPYIDAATGQVNWSGAYGGVFGGGGFLTAKTKGPAVANSKIDADGALGGVYTGVNFIVYNRIMLGFEGSTAYSEITGRGREPTGPASFRSYVEGDVRGRVGYTFGNILPFVAGGVLVSRSEQIDTASGSEKGRVFNEALTVGGGLDYRVTERVSVRGEYMYVSSFNKKIVNLNNCATCKQELDGNIFRVGAAYHFE